jgi:hypothetical protein
MDVPGPDRVLGVSLMVLWEECRQSEPDGYGYSRFCDLFREFERRLSPVMRQHPVAGDKVFVDYSGRRIAIVDPGTGVVHDANRVQPRCSYWSLGKQRIGRRDLVKGLSFNPTMFHTLSKSSS